MRRRLFLATSLASLGGAVLGLTGCGYLGGNKLTESDAVRRVLGGAERLDHAVIGTRGMAKLYREQDVDRDFRTNGFDPPSDARYGAFVSDGFASYRLIVDGEVERKTALTLAELRAMQNLSQITRHDCVEGWSAIGKWSGVRLSTVLAMVRPTQRARYVVFHSMDRDTQGTPYYESLDLHEAAHPQTVLALALNDRPLDVAHGAPVRLRVPTQLGYKSAKWVGRIELVTSFSAIALGRGGYWEDQGYEWYAGI